MQLEDYFDFLAPNDIRLKGRRIGIEHILFEYLNNARTPEEIAAYFDALDPEPVYAAILYYLHNKKVVEAYLNEWVEAGRRIREEQERNPTAVMLRLRKLRAEGKIPVPHES